MKHLDALVIAWFDAGTTWLQRQGGVPLNHVVMANICLFWTLSISTSHHPVIPCAFAAIDLARAFFVWSVDNGYQENARKALACNARSLFFREARVGLFARILALFGISVEAPLAVVTTRFMDAAWDVSFFAVTFLYCCRYLGPGDSREKRTSSKLAEQSSCV